MPRRNARSRSRSLSSTTCRRRRGRRRDAGRAARPRLGDPARLPPGAGLAQLLPVAPARARHRVRRRGAEGLRALTGPGQYAELSVAAAAGGWDWSIAPDWPGLRTACVHLGLTPETRVFFTAPRLLQNPAATVPPILGLLDLAPTRFGLAQVDVDGAMHKAIIQAETWHDPGPGRNLDAGAEPEAAAHPRSTIPKRRYRRCARRVLALRGRARPPAARDDPAVEGFNEALESSGSQPRPFFAEDLVRGYRLDVWDSHTQAWHSLHFRDADYAVEDGPITTRAWKRTSCSSPSCNPHPAPSPPAKTSICTRRSPAGLAGAWRSRCPASISAATRTRTRPCRRTGRSRLPRQRAGHAVQADDELRHRRGTLPSLRFGRRYRLARAVDLAGGGLQLDDPVTELLSLLFALPRDPDGSRTSATSPSRRRKS